MIMPPRLVTLAILLFWLGMTVWLFQREILPRLAPGEPPRFWLHTLDDSSTPVPPTRWTVTRTLGKHREKFDLTTEVKHDAASDVFTLLATLKPDRAANVKGPLTAYRLTLLESSYRVDRNGRMLGISARVELNPDLFARGGERVARYTATREGDHCLLQWEKRDRSTCAGDEISIPVSWVGAVLMPLHPLDRIDGLKPGRHWRVPLFDPLEGLESIDPETVMKGGPRVEEVQARVEEDGSGLVVHYRDTPGNLAGLVYVDRDNRVQRVTFRLGDEEWEIVRQ